MNRCFQADITGRSTDQNIVISVFYNPVVQHDIVIGQAFQRQVNAYLFGLVLAQKYLFQSILILLRDGVP